MGRPQVSRPIQDRKDGAAQEPRAGKAYNLHGSNKVVTMPKGRAIPTDSSFLCSILCHPVPDVPRPLTSAAVAESDFGESHGAYGEVFWRQLRAFIANVAALDSKSSISSGSSI
jgi:hypothetical protein